METKQYDINRIYIYGDDLSNAYYMKSRKDGLYECKRMGTENHDTILVDQENLNRFQNFGDMLRARGFMMLPFHDRVTMKELFEWMCVLKNIASLTINDFLSYYQNATMAANVWGDFLLRYNPYVDPDELDDFVGAFSESILFDIYRDYQKDKSYIIEGTDDVNFHKCLNLVKVEGFPCMPTRMVVSNHDLTIQRSTREVTREKHLSLH